jgi:hypothetical protein
MCAPSRRKHSIPRNRLHLETAGPSAATSALELAALGLDVGLLVLVGTEAEVLDGLAGVLGATEEEGVGTSGGADGDLINGEGLAAGLQDAGTGGGGEAESRNGDLGQLQETVVIGDGADLCLLVEIRYSGAASAAYDDNGLALVSLAGVGVGSGGDDLGQGNRGTVDLGHHEPAQDGLVEGRIRAAGEELVKPHKELNVGVLALRDLAVPVSNMMPVKIDTHLC